MNGEVILTQKGREDQDVYPVSGLTYQIIEALKNKPLCMYDLVEAVRHSRQSFRFIQAKDIVKTLNELIKEEYVTHTYE